MGKIRKNYSVSFKAKAALETVEKEKTIPQLSKVSKNNKIACKINQLSVYWAMKSAKKNQCFLKNPCTNQEPNVPT